MRMWKRAVCVGAIALAAGGAGGCAEEREPINRVQPNALAKTFFVGEDFEDSSDDPAFYARMVVTDVGYGAAQDGLFTSTYAQPPTVIKWEITEDFLIGRIIYQRIENSDGMGDGAGSTDGQIAYTFQILSHFDIRRDYNPSTGEESNIIVENTSDRPWDQREYMRVDWSRNLNTDSYDFDTLSQMGVFGGVSYEPLAYTANNPSEENENRPEFALNEGYFDVTTKAFATPGLIDLSHLGWGINSFPACYLPNDILGGSQPFGNCNATELTLRLSFRRVTPTDYEPIDYDGKRFAAFGIFYGERFGYARNYGIIDDQWHRFAARYNIWERSHAYKDLEAGACPSGWVESTDFPGECEKPCYTAETTKGGKNPNRDCGDTVDACDTVSTVNGNTFLDEQNNPHVAGNGTADECEDVGNGSQCDQFSQKCTMPYQDRTPTPIVWHFTKGSLAEYFEGTEWATHEWDVAMRTAVRFSKYSECIAVQTAGGVELGSAQADCGGKYPIYEGQQEENEDVISLSREVDDCRAAVGNWHDRGSGEPWSEERLDYCKGQAATIGGARGYSAGVISIAQMPEMVTLCHSPIEHHDSPACVADIQRFQPEADRSSDKRAVLPEDVTSYICDGQWEARKNGGKATVSGVEYVEDDAILETCDNGFYARIGDLRYHQVNVIRSPQTPSPWGIMVDADDPRTGEKIHASINIWSHVTDLASQGHVDMMRYIKGEIKTADITEGTYVRDWGRTAEAAGGKGALGTMDRATVEQRKFATVDGRSFKNGTPHARLDEHFEPDPEIIAKMKNWNTKYIANTRAEAGVASINRPFTEARRLAAQNTITEAELITPAMLELSGARNQAEINGLQNDVTAGNFGSPTLAMSSILRGLNPQVRRELRQARELGFAARGACMLTDEHIMSPAPNTLANMADIMERKFGAFNPSASKDEQLVHAEKIRNYIKQKYQYAVIVHEMGHSIGERHNFVSSSFAYGFRPQYWQLRTKDGTQTTACDDVSSNGENCVGPRYFDPPTQTEKDNLIWMFEQSSVMDYPGELAQDMIGLGAYDFAAARMFYGNTVAVHKDIAYANGGVNTDTILNLSDTFGGITGYQYVKNGGDEIHYTELQKRLNLISDCKTVDPEAFKSVNYNEERDGAYDPLMDALIVGDGSTYTRCKSPKVDYLPYDRLRQALTTDDVARLDLPNSKVEAGNAGFYGGGKTVDANNRLRVPYGFATDGWADLGNLAVYRHDNGADPYELFNFFITEQETRHIFDNYRRQRTTFSVRTQSERILGRYNEKMRDGAKGLGLLTNIFRELFSEIGLDFEQAWPFYANYFYGQNILASGIAFDHFTTQFARPEVGGHFARTLNSAPSFTGLDGEDLVWRHEESGFSGPGQGNGEVQFNIPNGASGLFGQVAFGGKLVENRLADGTGEYDRDYTINAGSYYDKVYAPYLLSESVDNFISDSLGDFVDPRYRSVSMADLFPDGYRRFLANQLTGEDYLKGPRLAAVGGNPASRATPTLDPDGYPSRGIGNITWWTPEPEVCFPGENQIVCTVYGCDSGSICDASTQAGLVPHPLDDNPDAPSATTVVEPQVGWEEWKWLIAQTLLYLPENAKNEWIDLMGIWELGADTDPAFTNRLELHLPDGRVYIARTYGTEVIFGRTVQRGVAARMLEYANELMFNAYECDAAETRWCVPLFDDVTGEVKYKFDPEVTTDAGIEDMCTETETSGCTCASNRACKALESYAPLMSFMRQSMRDFRMADATMQGIYD